MPSPLFATGIQNVAVAGIHKDIVYAGIFTNFEHFLPVFPAISGFIESTITTRTPNRTFGSYINYIAVFRINHNFTNMLGVFQPHIFPGFAAIVAFIKPIAIT